MTRHFKTYSWIGLCLLLLLNGCKKETAVTRFYHNVTARYNAYFNAKMKYEENMKTLENNQAEDFNKILPVFVHVEDAKGKNTGGDYDIIIKKCSSVIQKHPKSKWVDDCYLLIGKAYYEKNGYYEALDAFQIVYNQYKSSELKYEAMLWAAKCMMATDQMLSAMSTLQKATDKKTNFPEELRGDLFSVLADYNIKNEEYDEAVKNLIKATKFVKRKKDAARLHYILGQLYLQQAKEQYAQDEFNTVLKSNPPYDMYFNAQINLARLAKANSDEGKDIKKKLTKMLRDDKNKDFKDQIYYELGNLAIREKKENEAIQYYAASANSSTTNKIQKVNAYLKVADLYFKKPNYIKAEAYYDSAEMSMPRDYEGFAAVSAKKASLAELVKYLVTIQQEDSLRQYSSMSEEQITKIIAKKVKTEREEEANKKAEQENQAGFQDAFLTDNNAGTRPLPGSQNRVWYFYDQGTVATGISQFKTKYGNRSLEDNWRRSNKTQILSNNAVAKNDSSGSTKQAFIDPDSETDEERIARYLKNVPRTADAIAASDKKIIEAYYNLGKIYKNKLNDLEESIKSFEKLVERYPGNEYEAETCYNLYLTHANLSNADKANKNKNLVLNKYPSSLYAKLINDPNALKDAETLDSQAEIYYQTTYNCYQNEDYTCVVNRCRDAFIKFSTSSLLPKFELINALSIGKTNGQKDMIVALENIVKKYPNDEVKLAAEELLASLRKTGDIQNNSNALFANTENSVHYYIVIAKISDNITPQIKSSISDFNARNYSLANLKIDNIIMGSANEIVMVKSFKDKKTSLDYFENAKVDPVLTLSLPKTFDHFVISKENFQIFFQKQSVPDYLDFFNKTYQ